MSMKVPPPISLTFSSLKTIINIIFLESFVMINFPWRVFKVIFLKEVVKIIVPKVVVKIIVLDEVVNIIILK